MNKMIFSLLPETVVKVCFPAAASMKAMMNVSSHRLPKRPIQTKIMKKCKELIDSLARAPADSKEVTSSIFRTALNPNREKGQYVATSRELAADAVLMFLAGTDTTAHALTFGIWEMIKRPELWARLREEVSSAFSEGQSLAPVKDLETLPFLVSGFKAPGNQPAVNDGPDSELWSRSPFDFQWVHLHVSIASSLVRAQFFVAKAFLQG